ncbi:hypothetical protein [Aquipuribacter sp. SD81]|uniref:hypothetical protein n=1 Tax=Aquipuribacter sp. SD81 TaxID=3127703 RepID=UPI0030185EC8
MTISNLYGDGSSNHLVNMVNVEGVTIEGWDENTKGSPLIGDNVSNLRLSGFRQSEQQADHSGEGVCSRDSRDD